MALEDQGSELFSSRFHWWSLTVRCCLLFQALEGNILVDVDLSINFPVYYLPSLWFPDIISLLSQFLSLLLSLTFISFLPFVLCYLSNSHYSPWPPKSLCHLHPRLCCPGSFSWFTSQTLFPMPLIQVLLQNKIHSFYQQEGQTSCHLAFPCPCTTQAQRCCKQGGRTWKMQKTYFCHMEAWGVSL